VWVPVTLAAWYLAKQLEQAGKKFGQKLGQKLGGRVLGPAVQVATALAAVVLLTGDAQAEVSFGGEGKDPLVALFEYLESNGTPVPPELRERIEANPELQQRLRKAASAGDLSDVQKELMKQTTQVINDNLDQFSDEDLRRLAEAAEIASGGQAGGQAPTVAELKRGIQQARQTKRQQAGTAGKGKGTGEGGTESGEGGTESGEGGTEKPPATERGTETEPKKPATPETAKTPGGTGTGGSASGEEAKRIRTLLDDAPDHVERLLKQMLGGPEAKGPRLTADFVTKFVATTEGLTPEQISRLEGSLRQIQGESLAEILAELEKAVARVKESPETGPAGGTGDTSDGEEGTRTAPAGTTVAEATGETAADPERYAREMRRRIAGFDRWSEVDPDHWEVVLGNVGSIAKAVEDSPNAEHVHGATVYYQGSDEKYAGTITVRVVSVVSGPDAEGPVVLDCRLGGTTRLVPASPTGAGVDLTLPRSLRITEVR
jgi:hypothetical protein